jgi:two-component system, sensor histidine kinase PdtaS
MNKKPASAPDAAELRSQAEAIFRERRENAVFPPPTEADTRRIVQELEVHQIELEMQNEELVRSREELESSRAKYFDLFDLAPVGYLTLSESGIILETNRTAAKLLGVERSLLVKKPVTRFIVKEDQDIYYLHLRTLFETRVRQACELRMTGKGGVPLWVRIEGIAAQGSGDTPVCRATLSDITERKQSEDKLKLLLKEKEVLVKEVHHRVKNNFTIVSSLLNLQSQQIEDENIQGMFMKSRDRIKSMSLIHERLYQSQDLTRINLSDYISTLATDLHLAYETEREKAVLVIEADDVSLNVDQTIPCGLVLNELISNSLKYGFPPGWNGEARIEVTLRKIDENEIELTVKDNGVGLPDDFDIRKTKSLGLKIITLLVEDQLKGKLKVDRNKGTGIFVRFKIDN